MEFSISKSTQVLEAIVGKYVDRGDPATFDFALGDITQDDLWHDLNLAGIVPESGANHPVHLIVAVKATKADNYLYFREKGNVNAVNVVCARTQAANVSLNLDCLVMMDAARVIQYKATIDDWTGIQIAVRGWGED